MRAICVCKKRFNVITKRKMMLDGLQDIYFECPKCGKYYHVAYTDKTIRDLSDEMQKVKADLLKDKTDPVLFAKMQGMMRQHKSMMDELNKREKAVV